MLTLMVNDRYECSIHGVAPLRIVKVPECPNSETFECIECAREERFRKIVREEMALAVGICKLL